ncbi:MAG: methyltransferase domain-containing protein [Thermodesulfobacteriota bacterium]
MDTISFDLPKGPKLNLGCGPVQPEGWINIDGSNRAYLASRLNWLDNILVKMGIIPQTEFNKQIKYHDLLKGLPYPDNSVACIYAGELWEHFEYQDAFKLTKDCYRVLKPNGVLRVCVPDGPRFWGKYLQIYQEELSKPRNARNAQRLRDHVHMFFKDIATRKIYLGSMGHTHKWNFDEIQLIEMFELNGFSNVERMIFHKSRIPEIHKVERSHFLIVEGIKK